MPASLQQKTGRSARRQPGKGMANMAGIKVVDARYLEQGEVADI
jgi:hypothetical protein